MPKLTSVLTDAETLRDKIHEKVTAALHEVFPMDLKGKTLELKDVKVQNRTYSSDEQKTALLGGATLQNAIKGTLVLKASNGQVLDEAKDFTLVHVPYLTDRHTVISGGNEYQFANQLRRKPGVYTQRADNGELRTVFNLGKGKNFDLGFNDKKGTFFLEYGTSNIPLYPVLRALGTTHEAIANHLGEGVARENAEEHGHQVDTAINKLYQKLEHPALFNAKLPQAAKIDAIKKRYSVTTLDPEITQHTLGKDHDKVTPVALLDAAKKMLAVHKGTTSVDDTDSLAFKTFHSIDDFLAERIKLTARTWSPKARLAFTGKTNIREALRPAPFSDSIRKFVTTSSLTAVPSGINPLELMDHAVKVTALGEGGIPSDRAIPLDARMTHSTHFGALDPIRTPESNHAGVDIRATISAHRDDKGNLYSTVRDVKQNKIVFLKAGDLGNNVVAFPHQDLHGQVKAFVHGEVKTVPGSQVTHEMIHVSHQYSPATSLIPMIHNIQGNRAIMGSKMGTQALPLVEREAPFVQVKSHLPTGESFETVYGHLTVPTAPVAGVIKKIDKDYIYIQPHAKTAAGKEDLVRVPYETNFPFPSKTYLHHDVKVKAGDKVEEGEALADSNFTRKGTLALGKNLLVGYMPYHGLNSNDAVVISEGCAKKLTSEHMYREVYQLNSQIELSRDKHKTYYGNKFSPAQYAKLDEQGVIKPGAKVDPKDPLVLGLTKTQLQGTDLMLGRISKSLTKPYKEQILQWEHGTPGTVVEVYKSATQIAILVKTQEQMNVGDKLCYDEETEILTADGWKNIANTTLHDKIATLENGYLRFEFPESVHKYATGDRMYHVVGQQLDLLVTENHNMYIKERGETKFSLKRASEIAGKRSRYLKSADWEGTDRDVSFPALRVIAGQSGHGSRELPAFTMPAQTYAMLLGAFLSEGNTVKHPASGSYGIDITQAKSVNRAQLLNALTVLGIKFSEHSNQTKVRIFSKQLLEHFVEFGKSYQKFIPRFVFEWSKPTLKILFDWLMWGDGHTKNGKPVAYTTTSARLADDVQQLALMVGYAANIQSRHVPTQVIKGRLCACRERFDVRIVVTKLQPQQNHGHSKRQKTQSEAWIENYDKPVYGVTVPNGVVYVRRNGKAIWSGNSGRYGNKGVVSKIVPDHEMIRDEQGRPLDLILTSAGVVSRINPAQIIETAVGKVVEKTGKPIIYDNAEQKNAVEWAKNLLQLHGVKDKETVYDPIQNRKITGPDGKGVLVGRQYIYKLFKSTDTNFAGHGVGPYDVNEQPLKTGGDESAKGIGKMEFDALVAHGARNILQEAATVKSQKNDEFWRAIQTGSPMPSPKPSFAFNKFVAMLEGSGIKVDKRGSKIKLLPLTDAGVMERSRGAIENKKTLIAKNLRPETGGLFDPVKTGGPQGTLFSHIDLHEPIPHPVFVEPVRRLLNLSQKEFEQKLQSNGGAWFKDELGKINIETKLSELRLKMQKAKGPDLDDVVKQIKYLEALKKENLTPQKAYMMTKVPVVPPIFRPILPEKRDPSQLMVADANKLYSHLLDTNDVLKTTALESDRGKHRQMVFQAVGAVFGTHEAADEKLQKQEVKGFLQNIAGVGTPKGGFFQRKLMRRTQDVSGRGTAVPDGNLGMDEVGIPEQMLWQMLDKLIVARLVRQGYGALQARELVDKKAPVAREAMLQETKARPVLINRAPTLHRWSIISAYATPVKGKTIRVNPFIEKGMNLDYDGDTLQVHAPIQHGAIEDAKQMTMSQLLLSDQQRNKLMAFPQHEAIIGFTLASKATPSANAKHFKTRDEALAAYRSGQLKLTDSIIVDEPTTKHAELEEEESSEYPSYSSEEALSFWPAEYVTGNETDLSGNP